MRIVFISLLVVASMGCNQNDSGKSATNTTDTTGVKDTSTPAGNKAALADSLHSDSVNKSLLGFSEEILRIIKERNYDSLASWVHPRIGIRFSLYAHIDTVADQVISGEGIVVLSKSQKKIKWGVYDGTGDPVYLSIDDYFKKFVYDVDFLNPEKKSVNTFLGKGNSLNNLNEIYPDCNFTEFYFSGFDPKYGGMDWKTLRLVFKEYENKNYLVGIIHDQWTT